jgi:hypothetical protein
MDEISFGRYWGCFDQKYRTCGEILALYILYGQAKKAMNGTDLDGKKVRVDYSITKRAHTPTPGMYMGRSVFSFSASLLRIWTMLSDREIF